MPSGDMVRPAVVAAVVVALFVSAQLLFVTPAQAHNWNLCGNGLTTKFHQTWAPENWPDTWSNDNKNALINARNAFNVSDFQWTSGNHIQWFTYDGADPGWAGLTEVLPSWKNCNGQSTILDANLYFSTAHMSNPYHTMNQRWCVFIHEMGHVAGIDHNGVLSTQNVPHDHRCHDWEVKQLQAHELPEINSRY